MLSLEDVRQKVVAAVKTVHDANYATTLFNPPNFNVVDLEKQVVPFTSLELEFDSDRAAMGARDILLSGNVYVNFYFRDGKGLSGAYAYTDMLNDNLGMLLIDTIQYSAVRTFNIQTFPGWKGVSNSIKFTSGQGSGC